MCNLKNAILHIETLLSVGWMTVLICSIDCEYIWLSFYKWKKFVFFFILPPTKNYTKNNPSTITTAHIKTFSKIIQANGMFANILKLNFILICLQFSFSWIRKKKLLLLLIVANLFSFWLRIKRLQLLNHCQFREAEIIQCMHEFNVYQFQ